MAKINWYRMDNSAMIYPMVTTMSAQSLFRLSVVLTKNVNKEALNTAVNRAIARFPYYRVELKHGLFRHFFDANTRPIIVEEDDGIVLKLLNFSHNNRYLFRITYYEKKIFLDLFHGLCDANGGIEFLKTIVYYYAKEIGCSIGERGVMLPGEIASEESEDAFLKYFKKIKFGEGLTKMTGKGAFSIKDKQFASEGFGVIQAIMPVDKLLDLAHSHNCTLTVFLSALILLCTATTHAKEDNKDDFVMFIPINLRKRYNSRTMGNFTIFAKCIVPYSTEKTLEAYIAVIAKDLEEQTTADEMQIKLDFVSLMDQMPLLRYMPLPLKSFFSKVGRSFPAKSKQTHLLSNLGEVTLDDPDGLVDYFAFNLNCNSRSPKNIGVVTYGNKLAVNFTRKVIGTELEMVVCRYLADLGVDITVSSNYREDCDVL